jgi:hypothetical protein
VATSKLAKKIDKLEAEAEALRKKAEKKGKQLSEQVVDKVEDLTAEEDKGGKKGLFVVLLGLGAAAAAFVLKRKRDQELDEALWEEPRSL